MADCTKLCWCNSSSCCTGLSILVIILVSN
uniref:Uncharacterized protein n=1 Tax=Anguilla anguilla TaxID=7936 RepID=A0A0E9Q424_ANGAN